MSVRLRDEAKLFFSVPRNEPSARKTQSLRYLRFENSESAHLAFRVDGETLIEAEMEMLIFGVSGSRPRSAEPRSAYVQHESPVPQVRRCLQRPSLRKRRSVGCSHYWRCQMKLTGYYSDRAGRRGSTPRLVAIEPMPPGPSSKASRSEKATLLAGVPLPARGAILVLATACFLVSVVFWVCTTSPYSH